MLLPLLLAAALAQAPDPATGSLAPTDPNAPWVEQVSPGLWRVSVQCSMGTETRVGTVQVSGAQQPDIYALPHTGLARARGCLALASALQDRKSWDQAILAARSGLDALGGDYLTPGGDDATRDRLRAAENALRQGEKMTAARELGAVLGARVGLYVERNRATLAE